MVESDASRRYRQARQVQSWETRQRILAAAARAFATAGYAGCTIRAVAADAGVSVPTVELIFGTKPRLLKAVVDTAIAGDDQPAAVLERPWATRALTAPTPEEFLSISGKVLRDGQVRSAALLLVVDEAAASTTELAEVARALHEQRHRTATWVVDHLHRRWALRPGLDAAEAVDTVWALMDSVLFLRFTRDLRWTPDAYAAWFATTVRHLLLPDVL